MKILFYLVHPAKFHLFRYTINYFSKSNRVDVIINSKDVLEELVKSERWNYINLFPHGRNNSPKPSVIKSAIKFVLTIIKLEQYLIKREKYDVFITDDSLVVNGWIRRIPSFIFNDNDIETIKINKILFFFATKIISPLATNLGDFDSKKISFKGNKALASLDPKYFHPNENILKKYNLIENGYAIIRVSKINATHDIGNQGITDTQLDSIINEVAPYLTVIISAERQLNKRYESMKFKGDAQDLLELIYFASFFIGDSASMASEAAVLGTPNILINKLGKKCGVNRQLKDFGLQHYFDSFNEASNTLSEFIQDTSLKRITQLKRIEFIAECDDFNEFMIRTIKNAAKH